MKDIKLFTVSFRTWLVLLSAFASLPMVLFSIISLSFLVDSLRNTEKEHLYRAASSLAGDVGRQISAVSDMLFAISAGDFAKSNNIESLYRQAKRIVSSSSSLDSVSLIDRQGKIVFNTLRDYGDDLPLSGNARSSLQVIETGDIQVSLVFEGAITHNKVIAVGVPVQIDKQRRYCLLGMIKVSVLEDLLRQQSLPAVWSAVILSENIPIAAHGPLYSHTMEQPAEELFETEIVGVGSWGWRVAVSVPESAFAKPLRLLIWRFSIAGAVFLLIGMLASLLLARRLSRDISALATASTALATGHPVLDEGVVIREMGEVRACLLAAKDREEQAMTDPLTGLPGRARFWSLAGELEHASQQDENLGLAVMFIDLDGFKQVNDQYGHDKGDEILRDAAKVIKDSVRDTDVVGRLGGDEFTVCLVTPRGHIFPAVTTIADRIVDRIHGLGYGIGCSVGVSVCEVCSPNLSRALTLADKAMYEAKRLGKNRYVIHEDKTI